MLASAWSILVEHELGHGLPGCHLPAAEKGIALVLFPALPKPKRDAAATLGDDGAPINGLTIRDDRLDSLRFTLRHMAVPDYDLGDMLCRPTLGIAWRRQVMRLPGSPFRRCR